MICARNPCAWQAAGVDNFVNTPRLLALGAVKQVGDPIAVVVAESIYQANDALAGVQRCCRARRQHHTGGGGQRRQGQAAAGGRLVASHQRRQQAGVHPFRRRRDEHRLQPGRPFTREGGQHLHVRRPTAQQQQPLAQRRSCDSTLIAISAAGTSSRRPASSTKRSRSR